MALILKQSGNDLFDVDYIFAINDRLIPRQILLENAKGTHWPSSCGDQLNEDNPVFVYETDQYYFYRSGGPDHTWEKENIIAKNVLEHFGYIFEGRFSWILYVTPREKRGMTKTEYRNFELIMWDLNSN